MKHTWFCWRAERGLGWFRIFGYGLFWKNTDRHGMLFSERNGYGLNVRIGGWLVGVLSS